MHWPFNFQHLLPWRRVRKILITLVLLVLMLCFTLIAMISTQAGTQLTLKALSAASGHTLSFSHIEGRLIGPLKIASISIKNSDVSIDARHLVLQWQPSQLLHGLLQIDNASIQQLSIVHRTPGQEHQPNASASKEPASVTSPTSTPQDDLAPPLAIKANLRVGSFIFQDLQHDIHVNRIAVNLDSTRSPHRFTLHVDDERSKLLIDGQLDPEDLHQWSIKIQAKQLNLHHFTPTLQSNLNLQLQINSRDHQRQVQLHQLDGTLNKLPIHGSGNINLGRTTIKGGELILRQGNNIIDIKTQRAEHLQWRINVHNLGQLWPELSGSLITQGSVKSVEHQLHGHASIHANQISMHQNPWIDSLNATLRTTQNDTMALQFSAQRGEQTLSLQSVQTLKKHQYTGHINRLQLTYIPGKNWQLENPLHWQFKKRQLAIQPFCLTAKQERICSTIKWVNQHHFDMKLTTDHLQLSNLDPWLPPGSHLPGILTIDARAAQADPDSPVTLKADVHTSPGKWKWALPYGIRAIDMQALNWQTKQEQGDLQSTLTMKIGHHAPFVATLQLPSFKWHHNPKQKIHGNMQWRGELANIPLPQINFHKGTINLKSKIGGTLQSPIYQGHIRIKDASLHLQELNTTWNQVNADLQLDHHQIKGTLNARADKGQMKASLSGDLNHRGHGELTLNGNDMPLMMTDDYKVWFSPTIQMAWHDRLLDVSGDVKIPKARLTPKDFTATTQVSGDVVFAGQKKPRRIDQNIRTDLTVSLGDDVLVQTHGLLGKLIGSIHIKQNQQPFEQAESNGTIQLTEGRFSIYGQTLNINHGAVIYKNSPLNNPNLDIEASRTVKTHDGVTPLPAVAPRSNAIVSDPTNIISNLTVGIRVTGTMRQPITTLYSDPQGLSKSDMLSYLVLGKGMGQNQGDTGTLLSAIGSLGLQGSNSNNLSEQIKRHSGMPNIQIVSSQTVNDDNTTSQNYAVAIGRYISSKLYVSYSIGLIDPVNTFKISYLINQKWSLQMINSIIGSGFDLLYSL